mgnify:CR=1 FL=1
MRFLCNGELTLILCTEKVIYENFISETKNIFHTKKVFTRKFSKNVLHDFIDIDIQNISGKANYKI